MPNERLNDALLAADKVAVRWWKSKGGVPPGHGNESEVGVRAGACLNAFRAEYRDDVQLNAELASWGERQSESALVLAQWLENEGRVIAHLEARLNGEYEPYESSAAKARRWRSRLGWVLSVAMLIAGMVLTPLLGDGKYIIAGFLPAVGAFLGAVYADRVSFEANYLVGSRWIGTPLPSIAWAESAKSIIADVTFGGVVAGVACGAMLIL